MKKITYQPFVIPVLLIICSLFYYFGELVDWAAWDSLRLNFFYGIHDVHRLLFLAPIVYAGYIARIKGAVIITLVSFLIFLPRAFFISPYPDPLLRMVIFTVFAGVVGVLVGAIRNQAARSAYLERTIAAQRDRMYNIINNLAEGIIITGPDYVIRFMNTKMIQDFGNGVNYTCYQHLKGGAAPCGGDCMIDAVIKNRETATWACRMPDGRNYEVVAAPFMDNDGTLCQISVFRKLPMSIPA
jgi:K+-sensing histidine kinase KdpD